MRPSILACLMLLVLAWTGSTRAADFEAGCEAFDRGDFERALDEWRPLAERGHPAAQFRLGCLYAFGQGVETDHRRALGLYRQAAQQGDADAQNNLGSMLALGWGAEPDRVEGLMWLEIAARAGHQMASRNRDFLTELMTRPEITEAISRAGRFQRSQATN